MTKDQLRAALTGILKQKYVAEAVMDIHIPKAWNRKCVLVGKGTQVMDGSFKDVGFVCTPRTYIDINGNVFITYAYEYCCDRKFGITLNRIVDNNDVEELFSLDLLSDLIPSIYQGIFDDRPPHTRDFGRE